MLAVNLDSLSTDRQNLASQKAQRSFGGLLRPVRQTCLENGEASRIKPVNRRLQVMGGLRDWGAGQQVAHEEGKMSCPKGKVRCKTEINSEEN